MQRIWRLLALILALTLVAAACDDDDGGDGAADGGQDTGEEAEFPDLSGQTVDVAAVWTGAEQESFEAVLDGFEERTGATVNYTSTGDDIAAVLGTAIQGGDPPDVAMLPQPGLMQDLAEEGSLQPVEDAAGDLVDEHYAESWRELGTVEGTLYGVFFKAANKSTVWYDVAAWDNAGVEPPETWDELIERAQTIRDSGVTPFAIAGADGWTLTDWFENVFLSQHGPEAYDALINHELAWDSDEVKQTLETLAQLFGGEGLINDDAASTDFPGSVAKVFAEDAAATVYEGDFVAGVITDETDAELGADADFFPFPAVGEGEAGSSVVGGGDVAVLLSDSEGGRALIRYLATPEAAEIWAERGGFASPNRSVDTALYPTDIERRSAELLAGAETFRFDLSDLVPSEFGGTPGQGLFAQFQDFLSNPGNIDAVTAAMEQSASQAFG